MIICRIKVLQKKAVRTITLSKINAHTAPIFKNNNILTVDDIYKLQCLKFYHKYINNALPLNLLNLTIQQNFTIHNINTRQASLLHIPQIKTNIAKRSILHSIPAIVNSLPLNFSEKTHTHSLHGLSVYVKRYFISQYKETCAIENCYICNRDKS